MLLICTWNNLHLIVLLMNNRFFLAGDNEEIFGKCVNVLFSYIFWIIATVQVVSFNYILENYCKVSKRFLQYKLHFHIC